MNEQQELLAIGTILGNQIVGVYPVKNYERGILIQNSNYGGTK